MDSALEDLWRERWWSWYRSVDILCSIWCVPARENEDHGVEEQESGTKESEFFFYVEWFPHKSELLDVILKFCIDDGGAEKKTDKLEK